MAKITKNVPPPVIPPPPTYTVELSEGEIKGLADLLSNGVSNYTLSTLGLRHLYEELSAQGLHPTSRGNYTHLSQLFRPNESTIKPGDPTPCVGNAGDVSVPVALSVPGSYRSVAPHVADE